MSIGINLLYNPTGADHLDKDFIGIVGLTGEIKENTSIIDPIIVIQSTEEYIFGYTDNQQVYHHGCNYFSIPAFNRYYYLENVIVLETGLYELHGHVDVLMSFRQAIRRQTAIVKRQETAAAYNLYINDNSLKSYQDPYVLTEPFPSGFNGRSFVLAVAGSVDATPVSAPGAISDFAYSTSGNNFVFTWTVVTNALKYQILKKRNGDPIPNHWTEVSGNITTNTYTSAISNFHGTNQVKVVAKNNSGSTDSNIITITSI